MNNVIKAPTTPIYLTDAAPTAFSLPAVTRFKTRASNVTRVYPLKLKTDVALAVFFPNVVIVWSTISTEKPAMMETRITVTDAPPTVPSSAVMVA